MSAIHKVHLTWHDVQDCVGSVVGQLERDYDCMLVITRGGLVPACLISEQIDLRNIVVAAVMFYTGVDRTLEAPIFLQFPADPLLARKKVLIVDDVWDSGRTIMAVKARVEEAQGKPVTAVLHYKPARSMYPDRPDIFARETSDWLVYPWDPESKHQRNPAPNI
ncbi:MAG TPA: phosphoribosyltransferase family protein [Chloroflexota bacterium]|nr:phosphoribosyltransferase family protein [Chloroflexota bacterium]